MLPISYARHQFPPVVIQHAVWLYVRFTLSYRDVEDGRAWHRSLLRDDPALGVEVRVRLRPATAARSTAPRFPLAPRRDGGSDRWRPAISLTRRRSRRPRPRPADTAPTTPPPPHHASPPLP